MYNTAFVIHNELQQAIDVILVLIKGHHATANILRVFAIYHMLKNYFGHTDFVLQLKIEQE